MLPPTRAEATRFGLGLAAPLMDMLFCGAAFGFTLAASTASWTRNVPSATISSAPSQSPLVYASLSAVVLTLSFAANWGLLQLVLRDARIDVELLVEQRCRYWPVRALCVLSSVFLEWLPFRSSTPHSGYPTRDLLAASLAVPTLESLLMIIFVQLPFVATSERTAESLTMAVLSIAVSSAALTHRAVERWPLVRQGDGEAEIQSVILSPRVPSSEADELPQQSLLPSRGLSLWTITDSPARLPDLKPAPSDALAPPTYRSAQSSSRNPTGDTKLRDAVEAWAIGVGAGVAVGAEAAAEGAETEAALLKEQITRASWLLRRSSTESVAVPVDIYYTPRTRRRNFLELVKFYTRATLPVPHLASSGITRSRHTWHYLAGR